MKRMSSLCLVLVPLSLAAAPAAPSLESMFPKRAEVYVGTPGIARLPLPPDVLAAAQPGLSDVRLLDPSGQEIPYVIDEGGPAHEGPAVTGRPEVLEVVRDAGPVREREFAPSRFLERYRLVIPADPDSGAWSIDVLPSRREFVAHARIRPAGGGATFEAPLFRLDSVPRARTSIALPPGPGPREIELLLETADGWLSPELSLRARGARDGADELDVTLAVARTIDDGDSTVYVLERPAGLRPGSLRLTSATPWFDRPVEVWDEGAGSGQALLGGGRVARVDTGLLVAEEHAVDLAPASGERLRVRIVDGDSPPLEAPTFHAVVASPALLFHASGASPAATLVFGGDRVRPPRYDLAALASRPGDFAKGAKLAAQPLFSGRFAERATLRDVRDNPAWRDSPALGFAQRAGAAVDARRHSHRRSLHVPDSRSGLARLRLHAGDAAIARPDLADLRVVDGGGKQWPFLLDARADREWADLPPPSAFRESRRSVYALALPVTPYAPDELEIDSPVEFFDRAVRIRAQDEEGSERIIATGRLHRRAEDPRPVSIALPGSRVTALSIEVDDGDDAPLPLEVRVRVPVHDVYVVAPAGDYTLFLGDPSSEAPEYELAKIRSVVLATPFAGIDAAALEANPRFRPRSRFSSDDGLQAGVWIALLAAIAVLLALTVRLVRAEPAADAPAPPPPSTPPSAPPSSDPPPAAPADPPAAAPAS